MIREFLRTLGYSVKDYGNIKCPLGTHEDSNPSFSINEPVFYCHSCGVGGNIITLIKNIYNVNGYEAHKILKYDMGFNCAHNEIEYKEKVLADNCYNDDIDAFYKSLSNTNYSYVFNADKFLSSRCIEYSKIKDCITLGASTIYAPMVNQYGHITGVQSRSFYDKKFHLMKGSKSGVFYDCKNKGDTLYIVEGLTDYLSLRQFTEDVLGFVSASQFVNIDNIINKYNKIIYLGDNDIAGDKLKNNIIKYYGDKNIIFRNSSLQKADVNDILCSIKDKNLTGILLQITN